MDNTQYILRYLPLFYEDLQEKVIYISQKLQNPKAANELIDTVENAVLARLPFCESFERVRSKKERKYPYYRIYVKNFVVYYVVIADNPDNKIMEVRRFLYKKQEHSNKLF